MQIANHIYSPEPIRKIDVSLLLINQRDVYSTTPPVGHLNSFQTNPLLELPIDPTLRAQSPPTSPIPPNWFEERPESGPALEDPFPISHISPINDVERSCIRKVNDKSEILTVKHKKKREGDELMPTITVDEYDFEMIKNDAKSKSKESI